jgi:hypothetical protein
VAAIVVSVVALVTVILSIVITLTVKLSISALLASSLIVNTKLLGVSYTGMCISYERSIDRATLGPVGTTPPDFHKLLKKILIFMFKS